MDDWNGQPYDDDPQRWAKPTVTDLRTVRRTENGTLDPSVIRFREVAAGDKATARLWVEAANPGFEIVSMRKVEASAIKNIWRAELWRVR